MDLGDALQQLEPHRKWITNWLMRRYRRQLGDTDCELIVDQVIDEAAKRYDPDKCRSDQSTLSYLWQLARWRSRDVLRARLRCCGRRLDAVADVRDGDEDRDPVLNAFAAALPGVLTSLSEKKRAALLGEESPMGSRASTVRGRRRDAVREARSHFAEVGLTCLMSSRERGRVRDTLFGGRAVAVWPGSSPGTDSLHPDDAWTGQVMVTALFEEPSVGLPRLSPEGGAYDSILILGGASNRRWLGSLLFGGALPLRFYEAGGAVGRFMDSQLYQSPRRGICLGSSREKWVSESRRSGRRTSPPLSATDYLMISVIPAAVVSRFLPPIAGDVKPGGRAWVVAGCQGVGTRAWASLLSDESARDQLLYLARDESAFQALYRVHVEHQSRRRRSVPHIEASPLAVFRVSDDAFRRLAP